MTHDDTYIPDGWTRESWIDRLRKLAAICETIRPDKAAKLRRWADALEENERQQESRQRAS